jgi:hypothetical protein
MAAELIIAPEAQQDVDAGIKDTNLAFDKLRRGKVGMRKTGNGTGLNLLPYTLCLLPFSGVVAGFHAKPDDPSILIINGGPYPRL